MSSTRLTIGGFTLPGVARNLIEMPSNSEKGLSHRFVWMFPKPLYGKFAMLENVDKNFSSKIGNACIKFNLHNINFCDENIVCIAYLLATQWRKAQPQSELPPRVLQLFKDSTAFSNYYDKVQSTLQAISGMDELLAGTVTWCIGDCTYTHT